MAVKTAIWVGAHLRRCFAAGLTAAVLRKGDPDAGAVYVAVRLRDGRIRLYGPPAGPVYADSGERLWRACFAEPAAEADATAYLDRQVSFDPDLWVVEIDDPGGGGLLGP